MYDQFLKYYKTMFPLNFKVLNFLDESFLENKNILEVFCDDPQYSVAMSKLHYNVICLYNRQEKKSLIENDLNNCKNINLKNSNIFKCKDEIINESLDGVFCIGNSLLSLENEYEILEALQIINKKMKEKSTLVIEVINYDRILKFDIKGLPTIKNYREDLEFIRNYSMIDNKIMFKSILKIQEEKVFEASKYVIPLTKNNLFEILVEAGFYDIEAFGDFDFSQYNKEESMNLIIRCKK